MIWLASVSAAIWVYLLGFHGRFWQAGPVLAPAVARVAPDISIVVPARDEAGSIAACLASLLAQDYAGSFRVILVDDGSTDGTGDIARAISDARLTVITGAPRLTVITGAPRLTVITGAPRPAGWSGKLWAVHQGVAEAGASEFVLLTDADIVHDPRHLNTLVAAAERGGLDMVSEMVQLACESRAERALVPAFVFFFQLLYPFARVNNPLSATAAAAGGTILIRRRALERIGGIEAVRGELIDDVALAGAVKRGGRIWLGHSALARSIRPYPAAADIWRMVARTAYVQLRFSPILLAATVLGMALVWLAPLGLALFGQGWARGIGLLTWIAAMISYLPTLGRFGQSWLGAFALPAIACFYMAATIGSAVDHYRGRGVVWKRRAYLGADS